MALAAAVGQGAVGFRVTVDTVAVYATVRQSDGSFVRSLEKADFEVFDNGKRREITTFSNEVEPISLAVLIDRSSSLEKQAASINIAAEAAIKTLLPGDRVSINSLSWDCLALTLDQPASLAMLRSPMQGDIGTPLWAGLDRILASLEKEPGRRAILLFSDGYDNFLLQTSYLGSPGGDRSGPFTWAGPCHVPTSGSPYATLQQVQQRIGRDGPAVFVVSVDGDNGRADVAQLSSLAHDSGGALYSLKDGGARSALAGIGQMLHNEYLLGFVPAVFDGKVHDIGVRVRRPGLVVQARKTFVATRTEPAR
jgi:hypothetical protein